MYATLDHAILKYVYTGGLACLILRVCARAPSRALSVASLSSLSSSRMGLGIDDTPARAERFTCVLLRAFDDRKV